MYIKQIQLEQITNNANALEKVIGKISKGSGGNYKITQKQMTELLSISRYGVYISSTLQDMNKEQNKKIMARVNHKRLTNKNYGRSPYIKVKDRN